MKHSTDTEDHSWLGWVYTAPVWECPEERKKVFTCERSQELEGEDLAHQPSAAEQGAGLVCTSSHNSKTEFYFPALILAIWK